MNARNVENFQTKEDKQQITTKYIYYKNLIQIENLNLCKKLKLKIINNKKKEKFIS